MNPASAAHVLGSEDQPHAGVPVAKPLPIFEDNPMVPLHLSLGQENGGSFQQLCSFHYLGNTCSLRGKKKKNRTEISVTGILAPGHLNLSPAASIECSGQTP